MIYYSNISVVNIIVTAEKHETDKEVINSAHLSKLK
jgi:hypothetical protein